VLGELLKHQLSAVPNVTVEVCYDWYRVIRVANTGFMVTHGDKIRSGGDTPFTAIAKRVSRWRESIPGDWSVLILGHFHNYANFLWNGVEVFINGSPESHNDYAASWMGMASEPLQVTMFVHPKRGITARYPIFLAREAEAA
jgi:predicted phosphodiesterase